MFYVCCVVRIFAMHILCIFIRACINHDHIEDSFSQWLFDIKMTVVQFCELFAKKFVRILILNAP